MSIRLEHANLTVRDVDAMIRYLTTAMPGLRVRADRKSADGERWAHVGNEEFYFALNQATQPPVEPRAPYEECPGFNHLGIEVDDAEAVRARLTAAGYRDSTIPNAHPYRKRVYFQDPDGNDWEFVQYLSPDPAKRHDYALPDPAQGAAS